MPVREYKMCPAKKRSCGVDSELDRAVGGGDSGRSPARTDEAVDTHFELQAELECCGRSI